jgi:hypothetical protein
MADGYLRFVENMGKPWNTEKSRKTELTVAKARRNY